MAAALAPVNAAAALSLSDTRHQLVADLAPAVATLAFKGLLGHYNFTVEEVDLWDRKQFPLWDVPAVPCEALDMVATFLRTAPVAGRNKIGANVCQIRRCAHRRFRQPCTKNCISKGVN